MSESDRRTETLVESVSERVREMADAAMRDCRDMLRQAEQESKATRRNAERDAERARQSLRHVGEIVTELAEVVGGLRGQLDRLGARIAVARAALETQGAPEPIVAASPGESPPHLAPPPAPPPPGAESPRSRDAGAARLLALNMALNGMEREELDRHIAELFDIEDRAALLDDVYHRKPLREHG